MSFKRDGDDYSQLNLLKKRRVSDLLAEDIPEDEAFLMRSGRYACTVCHYRPVFDTIATLLVHRSGNKHLRNLKTYYAKRRDFMREVEKREQIRYLRNEEEGGAFPEKVEDTSPLLTNTRKATHHALLNAVPYKGYARSSVTGQEHRKSEPSEKKGSLFHRAFGKSDRSRATNVELPSATESNVLPGNRGGSTSSQSQVAVSAPSESSPLYGRGQLQGVANVDGVKSDDVNRIDDSIKETLRTAITPLTVTEKRQPAHFQLQPYIPKKQRNGLLQVARPSRPNVPQSPAPIEVIVNIPKEPLYFESKPADNERIVKPDEKDIEQREPNPPKKLPGQAKKGKKGLRHQKVPSNIVEDMKRSDDKERYLKMTSSGWRSDWNGGWIKDEDVEFDSDEDEEPLQ